MKDVDEQVGSFSWLRMMLGLSLWVLPLALGLAAVAYFSPTAREVFGDAFFYLIAFFGTPFVLEATVALMGLLTVVTISHWRIQKEGDGWVYLAVPEIGAEDDPKHRLETVVLKEGPEVVDNVESRLATIECFLDLGLASEALERWDRLSTSEKAMAEAVRLRDRADKMP